MYNTFGSSRLPVICVDSRSRRSLALPLLVAAGEPGLLAAAGRGVPAGGLAAGAVPVGVAGTLAGAGAVVAPCAEVFTPGSSESRCSAGGAAGGVWAIAASLTGSEGPQS